MIARIIIPLLLFSLLACLRIDRRCLRGRSSRRLFLWGPAVAFCGYSVYLALQPDFLPANPLLLDVWFALLTLLAVPLWVFALFCGLRKTVAAALALLAALGCLYGFTLGFSRLEVKHLTLYVDDLPHSFDGYRIVHFSDIHLGSFYGWRHRLPQRDIDSIRALGADLICFTGDLQNVQASEVQPYRQLLSTLHAPDGVYTVLGNHDYSWYLSGSAPEKAAAERRVVATEKRLDWRLLDNGRVVIHRGGDSIWLAGTANYDRPRHTDVRKALSGIPRGAFVVMLQHIPKQWRTTWPDSIQHVWARKGEHLVAPRLTLSGHTHGGQIRLLGLRPSMFTPFDDGLYEHLGCQLYTTRGLGGAFPFRLGCTAEIVELTLKCRKH